jgi:dihydropteroate synthase
MSPGGLVMRLPRKAPAGHRLYLRPLGRDAGRLELIARAGAEVERWTAGSDELLRWSERQSATVAARILTLLARIENPPTVPWRRRDRPFVMGIVNTTPDSFSDGGAFDGAEAVTLQGRALLREGADLLDIGGESTRPGALAPPLEVELDRVLPVLRALAREAPAMSIDTRRAAVMRAALAAGAAMVNDVSALTHDPESEATLAARDVPIVLVHMQGTPETMQRAPRYDCAPLEVFDFLEARIEALESVGIGRDRLIVDPGIGFGKALSHNLEILRDLAVLQGLGCPVLVGVSRKGFIGQLSGAPVPRERLAGSLAAALFAAGEGADVLRVHDVAATRQALAVWQALDDHVAPASPAAETHKRAAAVAAGLART